MEKLSQTGSRRMYSWWWDSHISPKNSKWLQENLTDMDVKVKSMIKLIEEDADSFARRAEMYYKKRPELMKIVEEFYRAYRALAERYDHATGVIRHAHRTMSEAFPNQVQSMFGDDSPSSSFLGTDPRTPPIGDFTDESDSCTERKTPKKFNDLIGPFEGVRRGLNFDEAAEDKEQITPSNRNNHVSDSKLSKLDQENDSEEILALKEALAKLESEKESGLVQYQQTLDKLSQLESEISKTCEDFRLLSDNANKAENEAAVLKEKLTKLEAEKESRFQDYKQCVEKLNERARTAEIEAQSLKRELDKLAVEKDAALDQYMQSLETISTLENKLLLTEEEAMGLKKRAEKAESEVEILRQTISKLTEEKEAAAQHYQQCLELKSDLEHALLCAKDESKRLNMEIDNGVSKLKTAEEQCLLLERSNQSLHSELESLMLKFGTQSQELTDKQKELGRLGACVQEERLRFVEAETAFQTSQHLHVQTQEEMRAMAFELQNRAQLLKVAETQYHNLEDEVLKVKEENKHLDELNASLTLSINDLQNEISGLIESKVKLDEEFELQLDQRNALQKEIYCLKQELKDLNTQHFLVLDQMHAVGLSPESLGLSVKELRDENSALKQTCQREKSEKTDLLEKLEVLEQLILKNSLLETSLSDLNAELEAIRGKIEELEQSRQLALKEKATFATQLQESNKNVEILSKNNAVLESFISNVHHQLENLKAKSKMLENSCQLLVDEKDILTSQLENTQTRLDDLGKLYAALEVRCVNLENEKELTIRKVEELKMSLDVERNEHADYIQMSETRLSGVEAKMFVLQEECVQKKREVDRVLDCAIANEIEIFVLRTTAQFLKENNWSLLTDNQKLLEEFSSSEMKISLLEHKIFEQKFEIRYLTDQASSLRAGNHNLMKVLGIFDNFACEDKAEKDRFYVNLLFDKVQAMKRSLCKAEEENLESSVEFSVLVTWIRELILGAQNLEEVKNKIEHEREALSTRIEDLNVKFRKVQGSSEVLQRQNSEISAEKRSLMDNIRRLEGKNNALEEENYVLCSKVLTLENLVLIFKFFAVEKFMVFRQIGDDQSKLHDSNAALTRMLNLTEEKLDDSKAENLYLKERLQKTEDELKFVVTDRDRSSVEIENGKKLSSQMALQLQEAEEKINQVEKQKLELSADNDQLKKKNISEHEVSRKLKVDLQQLQHEHNITKIQEERLRFELRKKINEINEVEIQAASIFSQLQSSSVSQLLYEQKFAELNDVCLGYIDQNEGLETRLASYGPEIAYLKECISSLENQTDIHIKFPYPENEELQGDQVTNDQQDTNQNYENKPSVRSGGVFDLHNLTVRLQAIVKSAAELKELMVQENITLHSKLDDAMKQLELQRSDNLRHVRSTRPTSEITEADNVLLTKDIVLDQISDGSSYYGLSSRHPVDVDNNQMVESWETSDPDVTVGLTVFSKSKKLVTDDGTDFRRLKSMKKHKFPTTEDKLDISKRSDESFGNKSKVLERLDSDVQKLANLQITVRDLKRKLEVTEKGKMGKAAVECEALRGQLEEADIDIMKLFEINGRIMNNIDDVEPGKLENERRRRRLSEKIGRLQLEVERLKFVLLKMDNVNKGRMWESKRRILLRDYLYGGRRKKTQFCACVRPSTVQD